MPHDSQKGPELVVGLVGPIGCDIQRVADSLTRAFKQVDYACHIVSVTKSIELLHAAKTGEERQLVTLEEKIDAGNAVRETYKRNGVLAAHAITQIREARRSENKFRGVNPEDFRVEERPDEEIDLGNIEANRTVYILKQLKRQEEVELLIKTYGKRFIQVSISLDKPARISNLATRIGREDPALKTSDREKKARELIERDDLEEHHYGQRLTEIFHLGDVFIESSSENIIDSMCARFVRALFGRTNIGPTRDEFGSYFAKSASLRSVDLARQVGAAIFSKSGDLIAVGCNEVPKPGGGNYWDEDAEKSRDIDLGGEANKEETNRIVFDLLITLQNNGLIIEGKTPTGILSDIDLKSEIMGSLIGDITEYGRMVHAEMAAITDAARVGRSLRDSTMYVTTFPCHNCAKHIIASGIERVIFIEPYPKSRAELMYGDAISIGEDRCKKVQFSHFSGISPRRFRDIFEKGKRRGKSGEILEWYDGKCVPRIGVHTSDYIQTEVHAIVDNLPEKMQ